MHRYRNSNKYLERIVSQMIPTKVSILEIWLTMSSSPTMSIRLFHLLSLYLFSFLVKLFRGPLSRDFVCSTSDSNSLLFRYFTVTVIPIPLSTHFSLTSIKCRYQVLKISIRIEPSKQVLWVSNCLKLMRKTGITPITSTCVWRCGPRHRTSYHT